MIYRKNFYFLTGNFILLLAQLAYGSYILSIYNLTNYKKRDTLIYGFFIECVYFILSGALFYFLTKKTLLEELENYCKKTSQKLLLAYALGFGMELAFFIQESSYPNYKNDQKYFEIELCYYSMFYYFIFHYCILGCLFMIFLFYVIRYIFYNFRNQDTNPTPLNISIPQANINVLPSAPPIERIDILPSAPPEDTCQICYENDASKFLQCAHKLCDNCYNRIMQTNSLCPFCRNPIL